MQTFFENEKENIISLLEKIVNIDSGSYNKAGIDEVGKILTYEYQKLGFYAEIHYVENRGNNIVLKHKDATNPKVLLIGHIDTVFPLGTVAKRPFKIEGDIAKGPGVIDMKASHVMTLYSLKYLIEQNNDAYKNVVIIINTDEEIGSVASRQLIEETAKTVDRVLIMEPANEGNMVTARKGGGKFFLKIYGKSAHSGMAPEKGASAIQELALKITKLHELTTLEGIHVNVGLVNGGTSVNTIAPFAEAGIDLRFETQKQGELAKSKILEICSYAETPNVRVELTGDITRPAWKGEDKKTQELVALIKESASELGIEIGVTSSGGGSDGNFTGNLGIPTVDSLGPRGGNAHEESEFLVLSSIAERGQLLINVLNKLST